MSVTFTPLSFKCLMVSIDVPWFWMKFSFIAERLSVRLLIVHCSQFAFVYIYIYAIVINACEGISRYIYKYTTQG